MVGFSDEEGEQTFMELLLPASHRAKGLVYYRDGSHIAPELGYAGRGYARGNWLLVPSPSIITQDRGKGRLLCFRSIGCRPEVIRWEGVQEGINLVPKA